MPKTVNIADISDWDDLDDYDKAQLVAEIRKKGGQITGLDPKEVRQYSLLGGYPDLPDMPPPPTAAMEKSSVPGLVQYGSSFAGGVLPGAKTGLALSGGNPLGGLAGGVVGGALSAGLDAGMDKLFKREPEGGNAANVINAASGLIPGGKGVLAGMGRSAAEAGTSAQLNNMTGGQQSSPLTAAAGGAVTSGLLNAATKPFGERMRKVANEKDLTDWLRARMGRGSTVQVGKQAEDLLSAANPANAVQSTGFNPMLSEGAQKFRELRERTGLDPLALTADDRKTLTALAGRTNDEIFKEILAPIFNAKKTDELPAAAETVRKGINSLTAASGKTRESFVKGLRKTFVQNVLGDEAVMNRPDSFRFRLEALGPDVVNDIFSSAGKKGERSGAYHALMNLAEAATKEGGHFKVLLSPTGMTLLERIPIVGDIASKALPKTYKLDTDNKFQPAERLMNAAIPGMTAFMSPGAAAGIAGAGAAREGLRAMHFTWEKAIEKLAARPNRASDILRILASGEQRFSRPMINNFMKSLAEDADEKVGY